MNSLDKPTWIDSEKPLDLRNAALPGKTRLLVLAPHPDDFDAVGAALKWLHSCGHVLHVAVADTGSGIQDSYRGGLTQSERTLLRRDEQRASACFFGLGEDELTFMALKNGDTDQAGDFPENVGPIADLIRQHRPDLIFLPHGNDSNSAHRAMHALAKKALAQAGMAATLMLNRDAKTETMRADVYFPFGPDEAAWKAELLRFHDSQQQRNLDQRGHGFDERVLALNSQIARELGLDAPYAESFEVEWVSGRR